MNVVTSPSALRGVSEEEWKIRCDLAALYRLVAHFRMTDFIYTHISARVPGPEHHFLINKYGVLFHEMRASDLVKIDLDGNVVEEGAESKPVNAAGFTIHSAIHMAREDAHVVVHTHTEAGIAVSAQRQGLLPISQHALKFYGHLAYHDYEGIALDLDERERLVKDLGTHNAMILRNHGLLVTGASIPEAFNNLFRLERACELQVMALSCNTELHMPSREAVLETNRLFKPTGMRRRGLLEWPALLKRLDRIDPSYRD